MKKTSGRLNLRNRRRRGMTLIEIVVVLVIIGLIAAAVGVNVMGSLVKAKQDRAALDIKAILNALDLYKVKKNRYPDTGTGLKALVDSMDLKEVPVDPWGEKYDYLLEGSKPVVVSYGANKAPGGDGEDKDISSKDAAAP